MSLLVSILRKRGKGVLDWLLATTSWSDSGFWIDTEQWID